MRSHNLSGRRPSAELDIVDDLEVTQYASFSEADDFTLDAGRAIKGRDVLRRVVHDVLTTLPSNTLRLGPTRDVVVPMEGSVRRVLLIVIGTLNVSRGRNDRLVSGVRLSPHTDGRDGSSQTRHEELRRVDKLHACDPILPVHHSTLSELLVGVIKGGDRLVHTIDASILQGSEPSEVELEGTIRTSYDSLIIDYLLRVVAIRSSVLPGAAGSTRKV